MALIVAVVVAGIMVFAPVDDRLGVAVAVALTFAIICAAQWPPLSALILRRPQVTLAIGALIAIGGLAAVFATVVWAPDMDQHAATAGAAIAIALGVAIGVLPRSLAVSAKIKAETPISPIETAGKRQGLQEAADALGLLSRERIAFVRIVGPWFLVFCLGPLAIADVAFWKGVAERHATEALSALLLLLLAMLCLPLIAAIQWGRFLATGKAPRTLDVPWAALWGFLWRLFFAAVILSLINGAEPWLKAHFPSAAPWMVHGLSGLFTLLVLVLASPWGMVFVAVALGAQDRSMAGSLRAARGAGRRFYLAMLLILSPMILFSWLTELAPKTSDTDFASWMIYVGWALGLFLTVIAATTYLTRIYLRSMAGRDLTA